jgi:hypothetical protein
MAIAPFLSKTVPERLAVFIGSHLPKLPTQFVNTRLPSTGVSAPTTELARYIREGFTGVTAELELRNCGDEFR